MKTTPITTTASTEELLSSELEEIFGAGTEGIEEDWALGSRMPMAYFNTFLTAVDQSGAVEKVEGWISKDRKSHAGRKALISVRAALVLLFLHNHWGHANTYIEYGRTIAFRLTQEQRDILDIKTWGAGQQDWYNRCWRAMQRVLRPIDPWYLTPKNRRLTAAEYEQAKKLRDKKRQLRLEEVMNLITHATTRMLPARYRDEYRGDVALDATFIEIAGRVDYAPKGCDRWNVDFTGGAYRREGDHRGMGARTDRYGFELETTTMMDITKGAYDFKLITGLAIHPPAHIKAAPLRAFQAHVRFHGKPGHLTADRAYNHLRAHRFQEHVRRTGYWTTYDYPKNQLGPQCAIPEHEVVMVDGSLYVAYMPEHLQMISRWWKTGAIDPDTCERDSNGNPILETGKPFDEKTARALLDQREPYRLKPMGRPDTDGHQRFQYPNPRGYIAVDPATRAPMPARATAHLVGKITVKPSMKLTRSIQKHPWQSDDWHRAYGQRNQVENSNKTLKDVGSGDIENKKRRTGRGIAFHGLVSGFAVAAENLRRIIVGITKIARGKAPKTTRGSKRFDARGNRIIREQQTETQTISPLTGPPRRE